MVKKWSYQPYDEAIYIEVQKKKYLDQLEIISALNFRLSRRGNERASWFDSAYVLR